MTIKKYRVCLLMVLILVVLVGALMLLKGTEEESIYKDGIMVHKECICDGEEYL